MAFAPVVVPAADPAVHLDPPVVYGDKSVVAGHGQTDEALGLGKGRPIHHRRQKEEGRLVAREPELPGDVVASRSGRSGKPAMLQQGFTDPDGKRFGVEVAIPERDFRLDGDVAAGFSIEEDRPEFSNGGVGTALRAEQRAADPEGERTIGMVGPREEAFVEARLLSGAVAGKISVPGKFRRRDFEALRSKLARIFDPQGRDSGHHSLAYPAADAGTTLAAESKASSQPGAQISLRGAVASLFFGASHRRTGLFQ